MSRAVALVLVVFGLAGAAPASQSGEAATARYLESIRKQPSQLLQFLRAMPKGGDLHNHLSGAVYAESFLQWTANDGGCLIVETMTLAGAPCDQAAGKIPVASVLTDGITYGRAIDAMSMRHWDPSLNGHDHFFATFAKFGAAVGKTGEMLAEVMARAASEHVSYLELMVTPAGTAASRMARDVSLTATATDADFAAARNGLRTAGFTAAVTAEAKQRLDAAEARECELLHCASPQPDAGCQVAVRYLTQVARATAPASVFTQILEGFELATIDPRLVGLNLVQPEDDPNAIRDFSLQMRMIRFLQPLYPTVRVTLHAGELTDGLVTPEALRFHIRDSVRVAGAKRIGHGVDLMYEDDEISLLKEMAAKKVLVEIALTSNDMILGVKGSRHPLRTYLKYGVPVALVTDDAGVARSSLTWEYRKGVEEQGLDYRTLKRMVRNSLEFSFADAATKAKLKAALEAAFTAFERAHGG